MTSVLRGIFGDYAREDGGRERAARAVAEEVRKEAKQAAGGALDTAQDAGLLGHFNEEMEMVWDDAYYELTQAERQQQARLARKARRDLIRKKRKIERGRGQYRDVTQKDVSTAKHCIEAYQQALRALNTRINVLQGEREGLLEAVGSVKRDIRRRQRDLAEIERREAQGRARRPPGALTRMLTNLSFRSQRSLKQGGGRMKRSLSYLSDGMDSASSAGRSLGEGSEAGRKGSCFACGARGRGTPEGRGKQARERWGVKGKLEFKEKAPVVERTAGPTDMGDRRRGSGEPRAGTEVPSTSQGWGAWLGSALGNWGTTAPAQRGPGRRASVRDLMSGESFRARSLRRGEGVVGAEGGDASEMALGGGWAAWVGGLWWGGQASQAAPIQPRRPAEDTGLVQLRAELAQLQDDVIVVEETLADLEMLWGAYDLALQGAHAFVSIRLGQIKGAFDAGAIHVLVTRIDMSHIPRMLVHVLEEDDVEVKSLVARDLVQAIHEIEQQIVRLTDEVDLAHGELLDDLDDILQDNEGDVEEHGRLRRYQPYEWEEGGGDAMAWGPDTDRADSFTSLLDGSPRGAHGAKKKLTF